MCSVLYISPPNVFYHQLPSALTFFFLFCWVCLFVYFCIVLGFFSEKYPVSVENFWLLSVLKEKRLWHSSTLFSALLIVLNHFAPDKKNTKYHSVHISSALSTLKCFREDVPDARSLSPASPAFLKLPSVTECTLHPSCLF